MKIKLSEPERQKSEGQYSWQEANHRKLCSDLFQAKKEGVVVDGRGGLNICIRGTGLRDATRCGCGSVICLTNLSRCSQRRGPYFLHPWYPPARLDVVQGQSHV